MADIIASLVAMVSADISGLQNGLNSASKQLKDFGGQLTTSLTLPIVGFAAAAVKAFSDSETELTQLNAVLKSTGGIAGVTAKQATDLAAALQKTTRYSDESVLSAENLLLTFTSIKKDVFPDATKIVLDMSTALGQDLKSSAIQLGKALQDPEKGITALKRVGVNFTKTQVDMIKSMVKAGNIAGAQKLILKELHTEFGGSAEAAGKTFAGSLDKLKNKFDDLMEVIGGKLAPFLSKAIDFFSQLVDKVSALDPGVIMLGIGIAGLVAAAGPLLTVLGIIAGVVGFLLSPIGLLVVAIGALAAAFATNFMGIRDFVQPALNAISNFFSEVGRLIQVGVARFKEGGVGGLLRWLFVTDEDGSSLLGVIGGLITDLANSIVTQYGPKVIAAFIGVWSQVSTWFSTQAFPAVLAGLQSFFNSVADFFNNGGATQLLGSIVGIISKIGTWLHDHGWETLQAGFNQIFQSITDFFATHNVIDLVKNIGDAVIAAVNWIITVGVPMFQGAFNAVAAEIGRIIQKIADDMIQSVKNAIGAIRSLGGGGDGKPAAPQPFMGGAVGGILGLGSMLGHALGFAEGGATPSKSTIATVGEEGQEYVVPHGGALVMNGDSNRPIVVYMTLLAHGFEEHIVQNLANAHRGGAG